VRDESGKFVRVVTGGDRGDGGTGKKRVRDSNNADGGGGDGGKGGGRGGGRGRGRGGGRGGGRGDARLITASICTAALPQDILSIVRDHHRELNYIHVSTAFNKLGKMAKSHDLSPRHLTADEDFQKLLGLARGLAGKGRFGSQAVANTTHGIAKLHEAGRLDATNGSVDAALAALEGEAVRAARDMNSQDVANSLYAYGVMGRMPRGKAWAALETAAVRVARDMNSQEVVNTLWSYATLKRMPEDETWAALETAAVRLVRDMNSQAVANTLWSYATLKRMPEDETWAALETAALRVARDMNSQDVANMLWSYATLNRTPRNEMWVALETAAVRVARDMNSQEVVNTLWSYATLNRMPGNETWAALETAALRVARDMNSQAVANTVFAYATLSILRDVAHPSCYAALWELVCSLKARDFSDEGLYMLFHVHLMHLSASRSVTLAHPAWLVVEARDAWMRNVKDDNTVSRGQRSLARVFDELGIRHEVERRTDDGYFSMDIYLPEYDVAVEFDGPTHYYHTSESSSTSQDASTTTRTAKTELRDFFLARQCARVVTVPYFEFDAVKGSPEKRRLYVKAKLAEEAGVEV
jgi:hypothetical protein